MKSSSLTTILVIGLILVQSISACTQSTPIPSGSIFSTSVTIPYTEVKQLDSPTSGRNYAIYIRLPDDYARDQAKNYPVLYVPDGFYPCA